MRPTTVRGARVSTRVCIFAVSCSTFLSAAKLGDSQPNIALAELRAVLCPGGALDSDCDAVCDAAEVRFGTDPGKADTDGDALSDEVELFGLSFASPIPGAPPQRLDLPALGANPLHRDVFVEIDYFPGRAPRRQALDAVAEALADAPVDNPDGRPGVRLHYFIDDEIAESDAVAEFGDAYAEIAPIAQKYANHLLRSAFDYAIYAGQLHRGAHGAVSLDNGWPAFVVALGEDPSVEREAIAVMYELRHHLRPHGASEPR